MLSSSSSSSSSLPMDTSSQPVSAEKNLKRKNLTPETLSGSSTSQSSPDLEAKAPDPKKLKQKAITLSDYRDQALGIIDTSELTRALRASVLAGDSLEFSRQLSQFEQSIELKVDPERHLLAACFGIPAVLCNSKTQAPANNRLPEESPLYAAIHLQKWAFIPLMRITTEGLQNSPLWLMAILGSTLPLNNIKAFCEGMSLNFNQLPTTTLRHLHILNVFPSNTDYGQKLLWLMEKAPRLFSKQYYFSLAVFYNYCLTDTEAKVFLKRLRTKGMNGQKKLDHFSRELIGIAQYFSASPEAAEQQFLMHYYHRLRQPLALLASLKGVFTSLVSKVVRNGARAKSMAILRYILADPVFCLKLGDARSIMKELMANSWSSEILSLLRLFEGWNLDYSAYHSHSNDEILRLICSSSTPHSREDLQFLLSKINLDEELFIHRTAFNAATTGPIRKGYDGLSHRHELAPDGESSASLHRFANELYLPHPEEKGTLFDKVVVMEEQVDKLKAGGLALLQLMASSSEYQAKLAAARILRMLHKMMFTYCYVTSNILLNAQGLLLGIVAKGLMSYARGEIEQKEWRPRNIQAVMALNLREYDLHSSVEGAVNLLQDLQLALKKEGVKLKKKERALFLESKITALAADPEGLEGLALLELEKRYDSNDKGADYLINEIYNVYLKPALKKHYYQHFKKELDENAKPLLDYLVAKKLKAIDEAVGSNTRDFFSSSTVSAEGLRHLPAYQCLHTVITLRMNVLHPKSGQSLRKIIDIFWTAIHARGENELSKGVQWFVGRLDQGWQGEKREEQLISDLLSYLSPPPLAPLHLLGLPLLYDTPVEQLFSEEASSDNSSSQSSESERSATPSLSMEDEEKRSETPIEQHSRRISAALFEENADQLKVLIKSFEQSQRFSPSIDNSLYSMLFGLDNSTTKLPWGKMGSIMKNEAPLFQLIRRKQYQLLPLLKVTKASFLSSYQYFGALLSSNLSLDEVRDFLDYLKIDSEKLNNSYFKYLTLLEPGVTCHDQSAKILWLMRLSPKRINRFIRLNYDSYLYNLEADAALSYFYGQENSSAQLRKDLLLAFKASTCRLQPEKVLPGLVKIIRKGLELKMKLKPLLSSFLGTMLSHHSFGFEQNSTILRILLADPKVRALCKSNTKPNDFFLHQGRYARQFIQSLDYHKSLEPLALNYDQVCDKDGVSLLIALTSTELVDKEILLYLLPKMSLSRSQRLYSAQGKAYYPFSTTEDECSFLVAKDNSGLLFLKERPSLLEGNLLNASYPQCYYYAHESREGSVFEKIAQMEVSGLTTGPVYPVFLEVFESNPAWLEAYLNARQALLVDVSQRQKLLVQCRTSFIAMALSHCLQRRVSGELSASLFIKRVLTLLRRVYVSSSQAGAVLRDAENFVLSFIRELQSIAEHQRIQQAFLDLQMLELEPTQAPHLARLHANWQSLHSGAIHATASQSALNMKARGREYDAQTVMDEIFAHFYLNFLDDVAKLSRQHYHSLFGPLREPTLKSLVEAKFQAITRHLATRDIDASRLLAEFEEDLPSLSTQKSYLILKSLYLMSYNYVDPASKITIKEALMLTWLSIQDASIYPNPSDRQNLRRILGEHMYLIQTEYLYLGSENPRTCDPGTFVQVIAVQDKTGNPEVDINQVSNSNIGIFITDAGHAIFSRYTAQERGLFCRDIMHHQYSLTPEFVQQVKADFLANSVIKHAQQKNYLGEDEVRSWLTKIALDCFPRILLECELMRYFMQSLSNEDLSNHLMDASCAEGEQVLAPAFISSFQQDFIAQQYQERHIKEDNQDSMDYWKMYSAIIGERFAQPFYLRDYWVVAKEEVEEKGSDGDVTMRAVGNCPATAFTF